MWKTAKSWNRKRSQKYPLGLAVWRQLILIGYPVFNPVFSGMKPDWNRLNRKIVD